MRPSRATPPTDQPVDSRQMDLWGTPTDTTTPAEPEPATPQDELPLQAETVAEPAPEPIGQVNLLLDEPAVFPDEAERIAERLQALTQSKFRMSWNLKLQQMQYIQEKGIATIARHAEELIGTRLAPAFIPNDGSQTPMKGHPVFIAQHATGTCCRSCLMKWHHIRPGAPFTPAQQHYVTSLIMTWMHKQIARWQDRPIPKPLPRKPQSSRRKQTSNSTFNPTLDFFK